MKKLNVFLLVGVFLVSGLSINDANARFVKKVGQNIQAGKLKNEPQSNSTRKGKKGKPSNIKTGPTKSNIGTGVNKKKKGNPYSRTCKIAKQKLIPYGKSAPIALKLKARTACGE